MINNQHSSLYARIAVFLLLVALIVLCVFLVREYQIAARYRTTTAGHIRPIDSLRHHSLGIADIGTIDSWMTFGYISTSFEVPAGYLMTALNIASSTPRYPNITLSKYARLIATSTDAVTTATRDAVRQYLSPVQNPVQQ